MGAASVLMAGFGAAAAAGLAAGGLAGAAQATRKPPSRPPRAELTIARISARPSPGRRAAAEPGQQAAVGERSRVRPAQVQLLAEVQRQLFWSLALDHPPVLLDHLL